MSPSGFADSQRPFAWMRSRISPELSAGPACLEVVLHREVAPGRLPVHDSLGSDHAGVADVDHVRGFDVEPDAKAGEEHGRGEQHPRRPEGTPTRRAPGRPDPRAAQHDPREQRIEERYRREDVSMVEEPQRGGRREAEQEIEVPQRERPPEVREPENEDGAEDPPDPRVIDRRAAEGTRVAAPHLPGDLGAGPRLEHGGGGVVDAALRDLARVQPPDLDRPASVLRRVGLLVRTATGRVPGEPRGHLRIRLEDAQHPRLREAGARRERDERRLDEATPAVEDGSGRDGRRGRGRARGRRRGRRRGRLRRGGGASPATGYVPLRNDQSLLPTKFSGVTRTTAIA